MSSDIEDIIGMSNDKSLTKKALMKALEDDEEGRRKRRKEGKRRKDDDDDVDDDDEDDDDGDDESVKEMDVDVGTKKPSKKVNKRRLGRTLHNNKLNQIRIAMPYQVPMWNEPKVTPMGTTVMYVEGNDMKENGERRRSKTQWDVIVMIVLAVIVIVCCGYALYQMVRTVMMRKKDPIGDDLRRDISRLSDERKMSELIDREKVKKYVREEVPMKDVDADMYRAAWGDEVNRSYERMDVGMKGGRKSYERSKPMPMRDAKGRFIKAK